MQILLLLLFLISYQLEVNVSFVQISKCCLIITWLHILHAFMIVITRMQKSLKHPKISRLSCLCDAHIPDFPSGFTLTFFWQHSGNISTGSQV